MVSLFILICPRSARLTSAFTYQPQCFWASIKMRLRAKENAFICKKQKSTPKKRIFRVPYAVKESSYAVNLDSLFGLFKVLIR